MSSGPFKHIDTSNTETPLLPFSGRQSEASCDQKLNDNEGQNVDGTIENGNVQNDQHDDNDNQDVGVVRDDKVN